MLREFGHAVANCDRINSVRYAVFYPEACFRPVSHIESAFGVRFAVTATSSRANFRLVSHITKCASLVQPFYVCSDFSEF